MLLTTSLLSKTTFFGSLLNKCRPGAAVTAANFSNPTAGIKTLEEKIGLPPRPKKPLTPYFRFMRDLRPKVQAENPKYSNVDVVKCISKKWETVDQNLKLKLQEEYKKDQQKYVEIRAKYDANITDEQRGEIKQLKMDIQEAKERKMMRKRVKDLGRPKKPPSGFLRFIIRERKTTPQLPNQTYRDWHAKCTSKWGRLSAEEKAEYIQDSRKELDKYKKDMHLWEERMIRQGNIDVVPQSRLIEPPEPKVTKSKKTSSEKN